MDSPSDLFNRRLPRPHPTPRINVSKHRQNRTDLRPSFLRFLLLTFVPQRAIFLEKATNRTINLNTHKKRLGRKYSTTHKHRIQKNTLSSSRFATKQIQGVVPLNLESNRTLPRRSYCTSLLCLVRAGVHIRQRGNGLGA